MSCPGMRSARRSTRPGNRGSPCISRHICESSALRNVAIFAAPPRRSRSILAPVSGTSVQLPAIFSKRCPAKRRRYTRSRITRCRRPTVHKSVSYPNVDAGCNTIARSSHSSNSSNFRGRPLPGLRTGPASPFFSYRCQPTMQRLPCNTISICGIANCPTTLHCLNSTNANFKRRVSFLAHRSEFMGQFQKSQSTSM